MDLKGLVLPGVSLSHAALAHWAGPMGLGGPQGTHTISGGGVALPTFRLYIYMYIYIYSYCFVFALMQNQLLLAFIDSRVVLGGCAKGRSCSRRLHSVLQKKNGFYRFF